jgi:hypothetical protein
MKRTILILTSILSVSCARQLTLGPKPDVKPAMTSNKATQTSLHETRTEIQGSQVNLKAGATALEAVDQYLKLLVGLPPKQQNYVEQAKTELHRGMSEFAEASVKIANADKRASEAELHAAVTGTALDALGVQITKAYDREKALAKDNARMKPVYDECTSWWDLGAFIYGFKQLFKHLLILAAVVAGVAIVGLVLQLTVLPTGFFGRIFSVSTNFIHRGVTTVRSAKRTVEETKL